MSSFKYLAYQRKIKQYFMALLFIGMLSAAWIYPVVGYFIPVCMILGIGIALFKGRKWCDWYCPRGSFADTVLKKVSPHKDIPDLVKTTFFRVAIIVVLMSIMTVQIIIRWPNPIAIGMFFVILLTITTFIGVILSFIFHQRTWCSFCPIGSLSSWVGKTKQLNQLNSDVCTSCTLCYKVCPVQIKPYMYKKQGIQNVTNADCLKCNLCISACPKKAILNQTTKYRI
ncbi:MAG: 4Fe-4S binding protein [bacterium]|nr:4Fe-4S binding protein [bacterium]